MACETYGEVDEGGGAIDVGGGFWRAKNLTKFLTKFKKNLLTDLDRSGKIYLASDAER